MHKKPIIYAFVDGQNLRKGVERLGWRLDYRRFRIYLADKFGVNKVFIFLGMIPGNHLLYDQLRSSGYTIVFKPTISYKKDGQTTYKGNVDAELVLYAAAIEIENYDKAIIVSSDGDFACLIKFLKDRGKLSGIIASGTNYSRLLREHSDQIIVLNDSKEILKK